MCILRLLPVPEDGGESRLPSQQPVGRPLGQHRGRCHAAVAEAQLLHHVGAGGKGHAHRCRDGADVVLASRRLLESRDELILRRRRKNGA